MTCRIAVVPRHEHAAKWQRAFIKGLSRHGIKAVVATDPIECDLAVIWSINEIAIIEHQKAAGRPYLVMEAGYIGDRLQWCSLGFNGLNGHADFLNANSPSDRWEKHHNHRMQPWKAGGDYILIMGQCRGDTAVRHLDLEAWYQKAAEAYQGYSLPTMFRPHPQDQCYSPAGAYSLIGPLNSALDGAALVVTYNSNSGVDAVLAGVPVVACDEGSMAWPVATHGLGEPWVQRERIQWAYDLAYCQWDMKEVASGEAWDHLKGKLDA